MRAIQILLLPISCCYGWVMRIRNWMFDLSILKSRSFQIPVISVGNLSYGGTGKTPHIEYLIRLLKDKYLIGTLSRGYGRDSNGFIIASKRSNYKYIGDEPMQFVKKFSEIKVAVDGDRRRGIQFLTEKYPELNVILLDDAFQHRYVKPGLSILLTDYLKLYTEDHVLPSGTLRESRCGAKRADIIIVTKTPKVFSPITRRRIIEDLNPTTDQKVLFSFIKYSEPVPVNDTAPATLLPRYSYILMFTGIANEYPIQEHLERKCTELVKIKFPDHHPYTPDDLSKIKTRFEDIPSQKKVIFTTEKDLMRLRTPELAAILKTLPIYYLPIEVDFHGNDREVFDKTINTYVEKSSRNS
jgi:tetraacyldisaccharide 4'-kinase